MTPLKLITGLLYFLAAIALALLLSTPGKAQPVPIQCKIIAVKWRNWKQADVTLLTNGKGVVDTIVFPYRYKIGDHADRPRYRVGDKYTLLVDSCSGIMVRAVLRRNN